jgi:3-oxoadipate enol-lactonase
MARRTVESADGTRLSAWTNDGTGLPVVLCNGLGTPVEAWSSITDETARYRVISWDQRGLGASARPADQTRITVADHAADLMAVMDAYGMARAIFVGWSLGVNVAFEVAQRDPGRVAAVLAVAGVAGGTFAALFHPMPRVLRPRAGRIGARLLRYVGPALNTMADALPASPGGAFDVRSLRTLGLDAVHLNSVLQVARTFARHDWQWYSRLARATGDHKPIDLSFIEVPVTFVAGKWDAITSADTMRAAHAQVRGSRFVELPATHFVPLQFPKNMRAELSALVDRSEFRLSRG